MGRGRKPNIRTGRKNVQKIHRARRKSRVRTDLGGRRDGFPELDHVAAAAAAPAMLSQLL